MSNRGRSIFYIFLVFLLAYLFYSFWAAPRLIFKDSTISEIARLVNEGKIEKVKIEGERITAKTKEGEELRAFKETGVGLHDYGITPEKVTLEVENPSKGAFWPTFISVILPFLLIGGFLYLMFRQASGANLRALSFGKSQARLFAGQKKTTFKDVAGLVEAKQELEEVVEFLKTPEKFKKLGAEVPKGVLLVGPTGTGKTLLARAVAGEANVPFFSISASEFVEMFVGVGASRARDLFSKAKRNAPAIVFIDELDAVGRQRGAGLGGSHDEREQTLNQILVEMDGFDTDTRVIVMAASNRPDVLDSALLRPGRFDRRVVVDLPTKNERLEILKIHSRGKPLAKNVDLAKTAGVTPGFSGADLKNIMNEAAILAARENRVSIIESDLNAAIEKVLLGPERKSRMLGQEEKEIAAYHEAGHAIVGKSLKHTDPIHKISVISRGMALGFTWSRPEEDRYLESQEKFEDEIAQLLGGRAAEKLVFGKITTGAQNDLQKATKLARDMVLVYGMSDKIGPVALRDREELVFLGRELGEHKNYSEKIASQIDSEISRIIFQAEKRALEVLRRQRKFLVQIAQKLMKEETIEGAEFDKLFVAAPAGA